MGKFDGIMLATDFDGTVAVNAKISEGNARAIGYFQQEGGIYTLCSGRQETVMEDIPQPVSLNAPILAMNGTVIYDTHTGSYLRQWTCGRELWEYSESLYRRFPDDVDEIRLYVPMSLCREWEAYSTHREAVKAWQDRYWISRKRGGVHDMLRQYYHLPLNKVIVHVLADSSDKMLDFITKEAAGRFNVSRSWINGIELQSPDSSKGVAVGELRRMLGERVKTVVCAGDYENDIPMLQAADLSYAVGNAREAVKAAADRVTVDCKEDAIAHIIADLENLSR